MISKNYPPTSKQKLWHSDIVNIGCVITGQHAEIDHLAGASAKQGKVWIGQWFVIAICPELHRLGSINRTSMRNEFCRAFSSPIGRVAFKGVEKELFLWQCFKYMRAYERELPFSYEVMQAIIGFEQ